MASFTLTINRAAAGRKARGFTLVESLIAATVLAASVIGITGPLIASSQQAEVLQQNSMAISLAQQLMEEITSKPFYDPVDGSTTLGLGATKTDRSKYNNIGDYDTYTDKTSSMVTLGGTSLSFPSGGIYTRLVHVEYRATPAGTSAASGTFALVQVTVTGPIGAPVVLSRLVSNVPWAP